MKFHSDVRSEREKRKRNKKRFAVLVDKVCVFARYFKYSVVFRFHFSSSELIFSPYVPISELRRIFFVLLHIL